MKIEVATKNYGKHFSDIRPGDIFVFSTDISIADNDIDTERIYMKSNYVATECDCFNCVNLRFGSYEYANGDDAIYPLENAALQIRPY